MNMCTSIYVRNAKSLFRDKENVMVRHSEQKEEHQKMLKIKVKQN
jgi:hypothetical protein